MKVQRSFLKFILRFIFLNLQIANRIKSATDDLHQIMTGVGISINLPKAPDVLMKSVAKFSSKNCL